MLIYEHSRRLERNSCFAKSSLLVPTQEKEQKTIGIYAFFEA